MPRAITRLFARVWPDEKFVVVVPVGPDPPGATRRQPALVGEVTVRLPAIDFAVAGTPHRPLMTNVREEPAAIAGPP